MFIKELNFIKSIYFTNIQKLDKKDGDYFFKRAMVVTFDDGHYVVIYFAGNDYENLHINYENPFKNKVCAMKCRD